MAKVVLVDGEITMVQMVTEVLRSEGHQVLPFTNGPSAAEALGSIVPEVVIVNLCSEKDRASGMGVLQKTRSLNPPPAAIMITAPGCLETAIEAMKKGAYDFLDKPFTLDELKLRVQRALSYHSALSENVVLRRQVQSKFQFKDIVGAAPGMLEMLKVIERVADTDSSVFICGRSGTGKKLVARAIHGHSRRRFAPFVTVSCDSLPESLLETELFGTPTAAPAGNSGLRSGALSEASGGTILLDRVGALPASLQARVLRILQDREAGGTVEAGSAPTDVRILAATDEPLEQRIAAGVFRQDLYSSLSFVSVVLPSLRERAEDIPLLISHFLGGKMHPRSGQPVGISRAAMEACCHHTWPGNVRELEHALERACVLCAEGVIQVLDLPEAVQRIANPIPQGHTSLSGNGHSKDAPLRVDAPTSFPGLSEDQPTETVPSQHQELVSLKQFLRDQELVYLHRILAQVGGSKEKAAELLGVSLATIYRKLSDPSGV